MRSPVSPSFRLVLAIAVCLLSGTLATSVVRTPPWLGLTFEQTVGGATLRIASVDVDPTLNVPRVHAGDSLVAIGATIKDIMGVAPTDLLEEPDFLDTWELEDAFYGRQSAINRILHSPSVTAVLIDKRGTVRSVTITPRSRPLASLPLIFWLQLLFGAAGLIIGTWVWALRPHEWGPRAYAVTGTCFLIFTHAAAIYSAREIALPGGLFRILSGINHFGAIHFGAALCTLFLVYPIRLTRAYAPLALFAVATAWWVACVTRLAPDQDWGSRFPVMLAMLGAIGIAFMQWRRTKGDPAARAVLRWFAVSVLTGCGAFIGLTAMVSAIGGLPPIPQGYAFGFFVLMYAGLAVGLRQYRVFDLDQWAYRILFWGVVVAAFIALDLALLNTASFSEGRTLVVATFLAIGTFPVRRWVWSRLFDRDQLPPEQLFEKALHVTYASSDEARDTRWRALLSELFDPLHAAADGTRDGALNDGDVHLTAQGQELAIPAVASSPALRLTYARGGKRLFTPNDQRLVRTLLSLMNAADASRKAYDEGVQRERTRIARDLHDTVSSPLLAGLAPLGADAETGAQMATVQSEIRRAVRGMRTVVSGDAVSAAPLAECAADARFASVERLTAAGLTVTWPLADLGPHRLGPTERHAFAAFIQESITNVIRHAHATHVDVDVRVSDGALRCRIVDDGVGFAPDPGRQGDGLPNLRARAESMGGVATIGPRADGRNGTEVTMVAALTATVEV